MDKMTNLEYATKYYAGKVGVSPSDAMVLLFNRSFMLKEENKHRRLSDVSLAEFAGWLLEAKED